MAKSLKTSDSFVKFVPAWRVAKHPANGTNPKLDEFRLNAFGGRLAEATGWKERDWIAEPRMIPRGSCKIGLMPFIQTGRSHVPRQKFRSPFGSHPNRQRSNVIRALVKIFCEGFEVESRPLILSEISLKLPEKWPPGQHSDPPEWAKQDYAYADLRRPIRPEAVHALRGLVREQEKPWRRSYFNMAR